MTAFLQTMASFVCLCALSALLARHTRLPAGLAPLPVCCGAMVWLVLGGYVGLLAPAAVLLLAAGGAALLFLLFTARQGGFRKLLSPGFLLFCVAGTAFVALYAIRRPIAQGWDEFSLWMTAVKLTKEHGVVYSAAPSPWPWLGTQKAGLPTFAYFFNLLGSYAAWRVYAAYGVLFAAVWAAVLGTFSWKHWKLVVPGALSLFLLPYFTVYLRDIYCNFTYLSAYADIPMAVLACGALAWYFHAAALRRQSLQYPVLCLVPGRGLGGRGIGAPLQAARIPLWPLALMTAAITLCKDTGLPLALIVAGVAFADMLVADGQSALWRARVWLPKLGLFLLWAAGAAAVFVLSGMFVGSLGAVQGAVASTGDGAEISQVTMLVEGVKLLLGLAPGAVGAQYADKFGLIRDEMIRVFFAPDARVTMVGCGLNVLVLVWVLVLASALLCEDKLHRRSAWAYGFVSTLGFLAYYAFIGFTYVFVFKNEGTAAIQDYNRYITTYYLIWVGGAFVLLLLGAAKGSQWRRGLSLLLAGGLIHAAASGGFSLVRSGRITRTGLLLVCLLAGTALLLVLLRSRMAHWRDCLTGIALLVSVAFFALFSVMVQPQLCIIDYPDVVYDVPRRAAVRAESVKQQLQKGDTVYYIHSEDDGFNWFRNSYELLPYRLAYSHGGGNIADADRMEIRPAPGEIIHRSLAEFAAEVAACDYIYVDKPAESFWQSYSPLFSDGGAAARSGKTLLYRVQQTGTPAYEPVEPAEVFYPEKELSKDGLVLDNQPGQRGAIPRRKMVNAQQVLTLVPVEMEVPAV